MCRESVAAIRTKYAIGKTARDEINQVRRNVSWPENDKQSLYVKGNKADECKNDGDGTLVASHFEL